MHENEATPNLPEQEVGVQTDIEVIEVTNDRLEAKQWFSEAKQKLLNVNEWHHYAGALSADFDITDNRGNKQERQAQVGDFFKIDIPGPGSVTGKGYDWVRVESIEEKEDAANDSESILMRVRPVDDPTNNKDDVAHFYTDDATSNFMLMREGNKITAAVHGRNEVPNTHVSNVIDKARNAVVGNTARAGASNPQWKSLAEGWLHK